MAQLPPVSLVWLDKLAALTAQLEKTPSANHSELARALNLNRTWVFFLSAVQPAFDAATIDKVRQAAQGNPSYTLSYNSIRVLARLNGKVADFPGTLHAALDLVLSRRLATKQVEALVEWIISGKPVADFDPQAKAPARRQPTEGQALSAPISGEEIGAKPRKKTLEPPLRGPQGPGQSRGARNDGKKTAKPVPAAEHQKPEVATSQTEPIGSAPSNDSDHSDLGKVPSVFLEWLAGISLFKQIQKKVKSGEKITRREELFLVLHDALKGLALAAKDGAKPVLKFLLDYGKKFVHVLFKFIHGFFKGLANLIVPLPHSSHSSGKHGARSTAGPSPQVMLQTVLHWTVYVLCQYVFWGFLFSRLARSLKPWFEFPFRYLAYSLFVEFPAWAWTQALLHWLAALGLGVLLVIGLYQAFLKSPGRMTLLIGLLGAGWFYGRGWGTATPPKAFEPILREPLNSQGSQRERTPSSPRKTGPTNSVVEPPKVEKPLPAKNQAPPVPVLSSKPQNGTGKKHSPQPPAPQSQSYITSPDVTVPEGLKGRVDLEASRALQFVGTFYGTSYRTTNQWQDYFQGVLAKEYSETFFNDYFPASRIEEMDAKRLSQSFRVSGPMELLAVDSRTAVFLVSGTLTTQEDSDTAPSVSSPVPVSVIVGLRDDGKVYRVDPQR